MRNAFADEITRLAEADPRVVLLSGDIGNRLFDRYKSIAPTRFYNCGVAEANMVGVAAGMAMSGLRPVAYTITPFLTVRCLEQIRVDLCYHNVPAILVGVGGGLSYAANGATHHSCEELAMLRVIPNMKVVCPADAWEVRGALRAAMREEGPVYIRIGKKGEPTVHEAVPDFAIGTGIVIRPGSRVCLLSTGNLLPTTLKAADLLRESGIDPEVVSFHTVKPLDVELLHTAFDRFEVVATIEEHSILGGLGGSVAEWLSDQPRGAARLLRIGTTDEFLYEAGGQSYARKYFGLTPEAIAQRLADALALHD